MRHFKKISELHRAEGFPPPQHPLFGLVLVPNSLNPLTNMEITCDFYIICLKKLKSNVILYGKTRYDHDRGSMFFMKPRQILTVTDVQLKEKGLAIHFHEDFL